MTLKERAAGQSQKLNYMDSNVCPICKGTGFEFYEDDQGRPFTRECSCGIRQKQIMKSRIEFANVPYGFKEMRLTNFREDIYEAPESRIIVEKNLKAANWWMDNFEDMKKFGKGFYLYSPTKGCGKTRFAISLANELIETKNCSVKFATSIQIINELKATWNKSYEYTEQQLLEELARAEVLIIDDFDTETPKEWIEERLYQIINTRYMNNLITIFTSNTALEDTSYDERIRNRILEKSFRLVFPNESIREQLGKSNQEQLKAAIA